MEAGDRKILRDSRRLCLYILAAAFRDSWLFHHPDVGRRLHSCFRVRLRLESLPSGKCFRLEGCYANPPTCVLRPRSLLEGTADEHRHHHLDRLRFPHHPLRHPLRLAVRLEVPPGPCHSFHPAAIPPNRCALVFRACLWVDDAVSPNPESQVRWRRTTAPSVGGSRTLRRLSLPPSR